MASYFTAAKRKYGGSRNSATRRTVSRASYGRRRTYSKSYSRSRSKSSYARKPYTRKRATTYARKYVRKGMRSASGAAKKQLKALAKKHMLKALALAAA